MPEAQALQQATGWRAAGPAAPARVRAPRLRRWWAAIRTALRPSGGWATPRLLRLVRAGLVASAALLGLAGAVLADGVAAGVEHVDTDTARALVTARQLRAHLTDADRAAAHAFLEDDILLTGPGQRYQDAITGAGRAIEQLAEILGGGAHGQALQAINAQLVTYTGLVEQADATYRAEEAGGSSNGAGLGHAYLWYASTMLHEPDNGLLALVDGLIADSEHAVLARSWWLGPGPLRVYPVAAGALLVALAGVQIWLARRFHRVVNPPLVLATVCSVLACVWTIAGIGHMQHGLDSAETTTLRPLLAGWQLRSAAADADGQGAMAAIQAARCPDDGACRSVLVSVDENLTAAVGDASAARRALPDGFTGSGSDAEGELLTAAGRARDHALAGKLAQAGDDSRRAGAAFDTVAANLTGPLRSHDDALAARLADAVDVPGLRPGVLVLAVLTMLLTSWGLGTRLEEYRIWGAR